LPSLRQLIYLHQFVGTHQTFLSKILLLTS
jgi:hypothetical protein